MKQKEIKGFYITSPGDPSVGIFSAEWELKGGFFFDDEELFDFKKALLAAFEYASEGIVLIETFEEREAQLKHMEPNYKANQS